MLLGYVVKFPPGVFCAGYAIINLPQYFVEVKYRYTGKPIMFCKGPVDGIGPREVELIFAFIFLLAGLIGVDGVDKPITSSISDIEYIDADGKSQQIKEQVPGFLQWNHLIAGLFLILYLTFSLESLYISMMKGGSKTLALLAPALNIILNAIL